MKQFGRAGSPLLLAAACMRLKQGKKKPICTPAVARVGTFRREQSETDVKQTCVLAGRETRRGKRAPITVGRGGVAIQASVDLDTRKGSEGASPQEHKLVLHMNTPHSLEAIA